jgi:hypothetical protein
MRASKKELPLLLEAGRASVRSAESGALRAVLVSVPTGTDFPTLLRGLPDDRYPLWGYVIKGRLRVRYSDGKQETLSAGDLFYLPPGHTGVADEDTDFLGIGPPRVHQQLLDHTRLTLARAA